MNSWLTSGYPGDSGWSATPGNISNQPSPSRREYAVQPPPLTTALNGHQFPGLGVAVGAGYASTPLSTTSLSSPFTQGLSPRVPSPGSAVGSSPMASRQPSYNVPYNPRDWGPVNGGHAAYPQINNNNLLRIVPHQPQPGHQSDISLSPPPPPYSPPSQQQQSRESIHQNVPATTSSPPTSVRQYNGASESGGEHSAAYRRMIPRTRARPMSMVHLDSAEPNARMSIPPPPPPLPQGGHCSRSVSHSRVDGYREPVNGRFSIVQSSRPSIAISQESQRSSPPNQYDHMVAAPSQLDDVARPPSSRRAVSAGPVVSSAGTSRASSQTRSISPPQGGWEPGMPLPPPPPGPPPTTRSHSISRLSEASSSRNVQTQVRTRTRPPPVLGTGLGSIPPTPADWVDDASTDARQRAGKVPLTIDTSDSLLARGANDLESAGPSHTSQKPGGSAGLFRSPAIRDPSAKGIRERRIERRNRQSQVIEDFSAVSTSNPWADALDQVKPSNLVLVDSNSASNSTPNHTQYQSSSRYTPRSGHSIASDGQLPVSRPRASSTGLFSNHSAYSTPRPEPSPAGPAREYAQTPPFSANGEPYAPKVAPQGLPPKALPTPPLQSGQDTKASSSVTPKSARPVSHILHLPNDSISTVLPLSPRRARQKEESSLDSIVSQDLEFVQEAIQRHLAFIEKESQATNETEALKVFADFIISESQIRRERYAKVWESNTHYVEEVRRKLFMPPPKPVVGSESASSRSSSRGVPMLDIPQSRPESAWWNNYQPCLSPIASLGMSNDEMSSRGRAPSRWWESKTGSGSEGGERRGIQRSHRESKYMGLPLESIQGEEHTPYQAETPNQHANYGPNEYPPEKVGWHDESSSPARSSTIGNNSFDWPQVQKMDVSKLITLPPPYPRHYPAVNNSHPDLVVYRTTVRSISDLSEIKATRQRHESEMGRLVQEHKERVKDSHRQFKANIQSQIQEGSITFAEAAEAEAAMIVEDNRLERELVKQELDTYQETVMKPMRAILTDRILKATACIDELSSRLFNDAQHETPDQTQGEGDEKPELLEKLTQLKWLFEARELLHREVYDLVSDRDDKYKTVVLLPYKQKANEEKVNETNAFFVKDSLDRRVQYEAEALGRLETFLDVIEENVVRGVEVQLSAFWDIAPSLLELIQRIPEDIRDFQIQIPSTEYEENPSYHQHPLQYLYSLLSHAERSSYQYIESQINLLCLLHEVKSAVMTANCKLMEAERVRQGELAEDVRREMQQSRVEEEQSLTSDLKDRVGTVEGQWSEALGSYMQDLRDRAREQLMADNGWEGMEELEQA